jgi:hypothetical protein
MPASSTVAPLPAVLSPSPAEADLLALARALTEMASPAPSAGEAMTTALDALAAAFEADAALPRALAHARNAALADHSLALALAWAREQLRLSLGEILERAVTAGEVRVSLPPESLAWLVLAACEALAHEPRGAAPDRLKLLAGWLRGD